MAETKVAQRQMKDGHYFTAAPGGATNLIGSAYTKVGNTAVTDPNGIFDNALERAVIQVAGVYVVDFYTLLSNGNERCFSAIYKNGSQIRRGTDTQYQHTSFLITQTSVHANLILAAGDYIEIFIYTDDGVDMNTNCAFEMCLIQEIS